MKRILTYDKFRLFEKETPEIKMSQGQNKKDVQSEQDLNMGQKICNFLKKHNFQYRPGYDSKIFVSFKTGKYKTIVPPKEIEHVHSQGPKGLYCFDMNFFKEHLFGDDDISPENFDHENLLRSSNFIESLCLGVANKNKPSDDQLWRNGMDDGKYIPRYLWFVKMKDNSEIISSHSTTADEIIPLTKLLNNYSHYFLKEATQPNNGELIVNPIRVKNESLPNQKGYTLGELELFFEKNKHNYSDNFIDETLKNLDRVRNSRPSKKLPNGGKKPHLYELIELFAQRISAAKNDDSSKKWEIMTQICQSIGIDGFTQRGEGHLHPRPPCQSCLVNDDAVEEMMQFDLDKELGESTKKFDSTTSLSQAQKAQIEQDWENYLSNCEKGDILYSKKHQSFYRVGQNDFRDFKLVPSKTLKINLDESKVWDFMKKLQPGDKIKIMLEDGRDNYKGQGLIVDIKEINIGQDFGILASRLQFKDARYEEDNKTFPDDSERKKIEKKLNEFQFTPWDVSKSDDENKKLQQKERSQEQELKNELNRTRFIFFPVPDGRFTKDLELMKILYDFKNEYFKRVFFQDMSFDKGKMTLYLYRGDSKNPILKIWPGWTQVERL